MSVTHTHVEVEINELRFEVLGLETVVELEVVQPADSILVEVGFQGPPGAPGDGNSGGSYEQTFTQASLSIVNILPVTHNLNTYPSAIALYDNTGEGVSPDRITYSNANAIAVDLSSFAPITGTWKISIGV